MDSTIVGVIIGSGLSLLGNAINQVFLSWKEQKQWKNQQSAEQMSWSRNEQKKEKEYLREIYQHSLRSLSVFIAFADQAKEDEEKQKRLELIDEIHKWVTMLLLRHSSSSLDRALTSFTTWPDDDEARKLRNEIIKLSEREEGFFINELRKQTENIEIRTDPDIRKIQITIDNEYRKQQIIEGVEISQGYTFTIGLSEMSKSQREKLTDIFFQSRNTIPDNFNLYIPVYNQGAKQINMQGKQWQAKLNPQQTKPNEILNSWEIDFENNCIEANQCFEKSLQTAK